jgi:hypothetical protein
MDGQTTLNVRRFLDEQFGGVPTLLEHHPFWPYDNVAKWRHRGSLPGHDLAKLLGIIEKRDGAPLSILPYLEDTCPEPSPTKPSTTGATPSVFD